MRIAICGCGIAGPTLAWWLRKFGHDPVLFEESPGPRRGGYVIDFWGEGYDVAERMGLLGRLRAEGYDMQRLRAVSGSGRTVACLDAGVFREATGGRYISLARSDLSAALTQACEGIEIRYGDSVEALVQAAGQVRLRSSAGGTESFDLVIGADGLHSRIRALAFGPQEDFERPMGITAAAFTLPGYRPREELAYVSHARPGRQVFRAALHGDRTLFLFTFASTPGAPLPGDEAARRDALRAAFAGMGWEVPAILERLDEADDFYFDRISQIRMPGWSRGRVALVGDAAAAPSLLAGEGAALAMTGAYVLAGELQRATGEPIRAFRAYEDRLKTQVSARQAAARKQAAFFAPPSWRALFARDALLKLAALPPVARRVVRRSYAEALDLPDYS